ncbi:MAG: hypothetical protein F6K34_30120, partial [Okeania sp. SIO4D6]|nr:hypothetical protein [Okeania sp. SIO4D6]
LPRNINHPINYQCLILTGRVGKHTDQFIEELIVNTEGKTNCRQWHTDDWGGDERSSTP